MSVTFNTSFDTSLDTTGLSAEGIAVVWLKRDLRLSDHEPLKLASQTGLPVLLLYLVEEIMLSDEHMSLRHWRFIYESWQSINQSLAQQGVDAQLLVLGGDAIECLSALHQQCSIRFIFSHQEIGLSPHI